MLPPIISIRLLDGTVYVVEKNPKVFSEILTVDGILRTWDGHGPLRQVIYQVVKADGTSLWFEPGVVHHVKTKTEVDA